MKIREFLTRQTQATCGLWEPKEGAGRDTHVCRLTRRHGGPHECKCGAEWPGRYPCTTPDCPGDARYAAPGRGHLAECRYPAPATERPHTDG